MEVAFDATQSCVILTIVQRNRKRIHAMIGTSDEIAPAVERSEEDTLALLHPTLRRWFCQTFGSFTAPQRFGVAAVAQGQNVLVSAPTGSGKTLSAFLAVINALYESAVADALPSGIACVYVSPLRALGYDIERNLHTPLRAIAALEREEVPDAEPAAARIRVAARTGDTSQRERRQQALTPPQILITTPESLAILLSQEAFRGHFRDLRTIIVDEIHALADTKRGSHLSLSLERLQALSADPEKVARVGLSATVAPLQAVARFLVGAQRPCLLVDQGGVRATRLRVRSALGSQVFPAVQTVQRNAADEVERVIRAHTTTLVFTNTRAATERLVHRLKQRWGDEEHVIAAHHSSLERPERLRVEEQLKAGALRAVVCSTSLELGIDIGSVDAVVLVGAPRGVARALQRIGRSGHRVGAVSSGTLVGTGIDDLVECVVIAHEARRGRIDPIRIPRAPLDVLAQQLVGMAVAAPFRADEAWALLTRAAPYTSLARADFDAILHYLAGDLGLEEQRVYAKLELIDGVYHARGKSVTTLYFQNIGTIADSGSVKVKVLGGEPLGRVEEQFLEHVRAGDVFLLGGKSYRFRYAQGMTAFVSPAAGRPTVPRWRSEALGLSSGLADAVARLRALLAAALPQGRVAAEVALRDYLSDLDLSHDEVAAITAPLLDYFAEQEAYATIPNNDALLIETFLEDEARAYVVHTLLGRDANEALSLALAERLKRRKVSSVASTTDDYGLLLRVPLRARLLAPDDWRALFAPEGFAEDVASALKRSELRERRFRHVAAVGLMLLRNYRGNSRAVGGMQWSARKIRYTLEQQYPDFPLLREADRTILEDELNVAGAQAFLQALPPIDLRPLPGPSPFAFRLVLSGTSDAMLLEDLLERLQAQVLAAIGEGQQANNA
jgi:ATP-dependent helicase Lhr and Lhr-like helicase